MEREHNKKRIVSIYQMFFEIARGNFSMRIPQSVYDDELETLVVLINMVVEELKESMFHLGYVNAHNSYGFMTQAMAILNPDGLIQMSNLETHTLLGYSNQELHNQPLASFLTKSTINNYDQVMMTLNKTSASQETLHLEWISKNGLYMPAHCTLVRFMESSQIILSFIIPAVQELQTNSEINEALVKQRTIRQTDALLIQKLYDYILANLEEPLPSLKTLARQFGTNEFKLKSGFRHFFKTSIYKFYTDERLKRAHFMIRQRDLPLKEIALITGFSTYPNFSKSFKKKYGYNPTDLKQKDADEGCIEN